MPRQGQPQTQCFRSKGQLSSKCSIQSVPGAGSGVVARADIEPGECLLEEKPLVTFEKESLSSATLAGPVSQQSLVASALQRVPIEGREAFWALHDCHSELGEPKTALGIFKTNAIAGGVYPIGARFNHSCKPNVNRSWIASRQAQVFVATQAVAAGTELCIYYVDPKWCRRERQDQLSRDFNFTCCCESCSLSGKSQKVSDELRAEYQRLDSEILEATEPESAIEKVMRILEIVEEEFDGDPHMAMRAFHDGFQMAEICGDQELASMMLGRAHEALLLAQGPSEEADLMLARINQLDSNENFPQPPVAAHADNLSDRRKRRQTLSFANRCPCNNELCRQQAPAVSATRPIDEVPTSASVNANFLCLSAMD